MRSKAKSSGWCRDNDANDIEMIAEHRAPGYTPTARALHWVTAALVLVTAPIGIGIVYVGFGPAQDTLYHLHRSIGVILLPLVVVRLIWRFYQPPPPLPDSIDPMQRAMANVVHLVLYALLIVQSLVGWVATSAYRAPILVFWLFELPPIWPVDRPFSESMFAVHRFLGIGLVVLIVGHVGAALHHHFVRKDEVLMRMLRG